MWNLVMFQLWNQLGSAKSKAELCATFTQVIDSEPDQPQVLLTNGRRVPPNQGKCPPGSKEAGFEKKAVYTIRHG